MFDVFKQTRVYTGYPYKGYSWNDTDDARFETFEQAREAVKYLIPVILGISITGRRELNTNEA